MLFDHANQCVGDVEYTGTFAVTEGSMKLLSIGTVVKTGTFAVVDGSINESSSWQLFDAWSYVVPSGHASHALFLHKGLAAGHGSQALEIVLKYWFAKQFEHFLVSWSQYWGKLHCKHFVPSLKGRFGGQTHCLTLSSQTKFDVQVWTVGIVGTIGVAAGQ